MQPGPYPPTKISAKSLAVVPMDTIATKTLIAHRKKSSGKFIVGETSFYDTSSAGKLSRSSLAFEYVSTPGAVFTFFNGEKTKSEQELSKAVRFCGIAYNELLGPSQGLPSATGKKVSIVVHGSLSIPALAPRRLHVGDKLRYCLPRLEKSKLLEQYQIDEADLPHTDLVATVEEVPVDNTRLSLAHATTAESFNRAIFLSILKMNGIIPEAQQFQIWNFLTQGTPMEDETKSARTKFLQFHANSTAQEEFWAMRLNYNPLAGNTALNAVYEVMKENPLAHIFDYLRLLREEDQTHFGYVTKPANDFGGNLDVLVKI